jgi:ABC-type dipeptide/oligopeptide/nickel transport system permease component
MARFVANKLLGGLAAVFGASIVAFAFMRVLPGDPARLVLGPLATDAAIASLREKMGLNDHLWVQYFRYLKAFFTGDWGFAYSAGQPVTEQIGSRLPASIELGLYAFLFAFVLSVALALVATYRRSGLVDGLVRAFSFISLGTPQFWFALVLLIVFFERLSLLPGPEGRLSPDREPPHARTHLYTLDALLAGQFTTFWDAFKHLVLPAIALGLPAFGFLVRLLRANLLEVAREPFIVVARSKGLSRWDAFVRHALPNAFLPTLTASGLLFAQLIAGSVLVEKVFAWPGVGALVVDSILQQDFAVVQAFVLLSAVAYVSVNLLVDLLYGVIDPRVRTGRAGAS